MNHDGGNGMAKDYLSVDEAAEELGVSRATVWNWIKRTEMPTFRVIGDRRTMIRRSDIETLRQPIPKIAA
jgi:excisionase family DNA binding protein